MMSWRELLCPSCGDTVYSIAGLLTHCEVYEPIDDLDDDA